jgi:hypothetical protein
MAQLVARQLGSTRQPAYRGLRGETRADLRTGECAGGRDAGRNQAVEGRA